MTILSKFRGLREILLFDNRWELIWNRLFFRDTRLQVYRLGELEFILDHAAGDAPGIRSCIATDMYKPVLRKIDSKDDITVLDLGANAGGLPLMLLAAGIRIARLVCVELHPETFARLQFNMLRNCASKCKCLNAAVCGKPRSFEVASNNNCSTSNSIFDPPALSGARHHKVQGYTFDHIARSLSDNTDSLVIDLCKMDIEGAEYEIFSEPGHDLLRAVHFLLIEIHEPPKAVLGDRTIITEALKDIGFLPCFPPDARWPDVFLFENQSLSRGNV